VGRIEQSTTSVVAREQLTSLKISGRLFQGGPRYLKLPSRGSCPVSEKRDVNRVAQRMSTDRTSGRHGQPSSSGSYLYEPSISSRVLFPDLVSRDDSPCLVSPQINQGWCRVALLFSLVAPGQRPNRSPCVMFVSSRFVSPKSSPPA